MWFAAFFVIKGTVDEASIEDASFFRLLMPAFPAFSPARAAIPLLVPTVGLAKRVVRAGAGAPPARRRPALGVAAALLSSCR